MGWVATPVNWNKALVIWLIESTTEQKKYCQFFNYDLHYSFQALHIDQPCPNFKNVQNIDIIRKKYCNEFLWPKGSQNILSLNCNKMSGWLSHRTALESPRCRISVTLSRGLFPTSKKGKEKRRYSLLVFWMESFRCTNRLSYRDNGSRPPCCVLPAPLPPHSPSLYLPLSRNTRHILLNTTHQPKVHFLLLSSSPSHQPYSQDMH